MIQTEIDYGGEPQNKNNYSTNLMGYSIQNSETGEVDYISDVASLEHLNYDEETGEPVNGQRKLRLTKHRPFQIPKMLLKGTACEEFEKRMTGETQDNEESKGIQVKIIMKDQKVDEPKKNFYNRDDYINMEGVKNEIILAYNKSNILLFLVPSLFCFNIYLAMLIGILELFLHFVAHRKNIFNMNNKIYYRSPLHVLTSQFCATCRSEAEIDIEIFRMLNKQMRKAKQSKTLKDVSKALS